MSMESPIKKRKVNSAKLPIMDPIVPIPMIHLPITPTSSEGISSSNSSQVTPFNFSITPIQLPNNNSNSQSENNGNNGNNVVGTGSYWKVHRDPTSPSHVIRVGTSIKNAYIRAAAKRHSNQFLNMTRNSRNRNQLLRYEDLPATLKTQYQKYNTTVQAMRSPYLGVDLLKYVTMYQDSPAFSILLPQLHTLIRQTFLLSKHRMSHADIHSSNIMIDPNRVELHFIDFDLFDTFENTLKRMKTESKHVIHPWVPPEFLYHFNQDGKIESYYKNLYQHYSEYYKCHHITPEILRLMILSSNHDNKASYPNATADSILYLDNFGLGMSLLQLLTILYHPCAMKSNVQSELSMVIRGLKDVQVDPQNTREKKEIERTIQSISFEMAKVNNDNVDTLAELKKRKKQQQERLSALSKREYVTPTESAEKLLQKDTNAGKRILNILNRQTYSESDILQRTVALLQKMVDFRIQKRATPADAYRVMTDILTDQYQNDLEKVRAIRAMYEADTRVNQKNGGRRRRTIRK